MWGCRILSKVQPRARSHGRVRAPARNDRQLRRGICSDSSMAGSTAAGCEPSPGAEPSLAVSYGGALHRLRLDPDATTLGELSEALAGTCGVDRDTIKLLPPRARAPVLPATEPARLASEAGESTHNCLASSAVGYRAQGCL